MMKKQTPARMQQFVARWRASGELGAGFARRHGIPAWTFWYWCRKLMSMRIAATAPAFAPVHVTADGAVVEIVWPDGPRVQVRAGGGRARRRRGGARDMLTLSPAVRIYLAGRRDGSAPVDL